MFTRNLSILFLFTDLCSGFVPKLPQTFHLNNGVKSSTSRAVVDTPFPVDAYSLSIEDIKAARAAFALCFFGAAGTASLGREVIPKTWNQWKSTQSLIGSGKGSGGAEMNVFGYPEPVYVDDVLSVLNNDLTAVEIEKKFPGKYQGYLQFESLVEANQDVSPMAVRAVFDSLAIGINKNQIMAGRADTIFQMYRNDMDEMEKNIRLGKTIGVAAFVILLGLLGIADWFALYHLLRGWFPDWQGLSDLPLSLIDERGVSSLGSCFIGDV